MYDLVKEFYLLKQELKALRKCDKSKLEITRAGKTASQEITNLEETMPWPPHTDNLKEENMLPSSLDLFFNVILSGKLQKSQSPRIHQLKLSIGFDFINKS